MRYVNKYPIAHKLGLAKSALGLCRWQIRGHLDKTIPDLATAVQGSGDHAVVMIGGFGGSGAPIKLIHAVIDRFRATGHPVGLTVVNTNAENGHIGLAALIEAGMVRKLICSFPALG